MLLDAGLVATDRNGQSQTAIMYAAVNTNADVLKTLLDARAAGANVEDRGNTGRTALMASGGNQSPEVPTALLAAGAKPNDRDTSGMTPLMWAAHSAKDRAVLQVFLASGAAVNDHDNNGQHEIALDLAAGNPRMIGSPAFQNLRGLTNARLSR